MTRPGACCRWIIASGYGSDADHLKHISDIDDCIDAGFTGFTLDPNEHVDNAAHS